MRGEKKCSTIVKIHKEKEPNTIQGFYIQKTFNEKTIDKLLTTCKNSRNIVSMSPFLGIYWRLSFRHSHGRKDINVKTCDELTLHVELI